MKFGCAICIFLNSENLICRGTDISKFSEGPFNFKITRVDCIWYDNYSNKICNLSIKKTNKQKSLYSEASKENLNTDVF